MDKMDNLIIKQFEVGPMENFIYFIGDKNTNDIVVVDPAWDVRYILNAASSEGLNIKGALITHGHSDHTNGVDELLKHLDIPIYINKEEADFFKFDWKGSVKKVSSGENINIGSINIEFIHTPGHTPGSQCFHVKGNLVSGDTLFINGCGRCDLPGGNVEQMFDTMYNKLMKMDENTILFPGHNYSEKKQDTLKNQKQTNPFMQYDNLMSFVGKRMKGLKVD